MSWSRFFRRDQWDEERAREIDAYIEEETAENVARGMTADEARFAARRRLGNSTRLREDIYEFNTVSWLESLWRDLVFGARLLRKNPGFAFVAILSLALGIGANAAIFDLLNAVRLRSLPIAHPEELVEVRMTDMSTVRGYKNVYGRFTNPLWEHLRDQQQLFSGLFAWGSRDFNLARGGDMRKAHGLWVSGDFFRVLGVRPILGRVLTAGDDQRGCGTPGAIISEGLWRREFGGDPGVIGKTISLDNHPVSIVGVTPASFFGLEVGARFDVAVPMCSEPSLSSSNVMNDGTMWWLTVMGRLKPGISMARASAQLSAMSPQIFRTTLPANYPKESVKDYLALRLNAYPAGAGVSDLREQYSRSLAFLLALSGLVLLVACANLANLMLARAGARRREIAIRLSLGAARTRIVRQLLSESLLLALAGTALGAVLAYYLSRVLVTALDVTLDLSPDLRVFAFMTTLAVAATVLFGLSPALRASRGGPAEVLAAVGRGISGDRTRAGMRRSLVVAQIALSLVLVIGALLFARSLRNILSIDPGFQRSGIVITSVDYSALHLSTERSVLFEHELVSRVRAVPGIDSAAATYAPPLSGFGWGNLVWTTSSSPAQAQGSAFSYVGSDYFKTFQTKLLAGREFDDRDTPTSTLVAIVNREFVRRLGLGDHAVGTSFWRQATPYYPQMQFQIIGVVENTKFYDVREPFDPIVFLFTEQMTGSLRPPLSIVAHSRLSAAEAMTATKHAIVDFAPLAGVSSFSFEQQMKDSLLQERLMSELSGFFGALAALLAIVGIYGLMSYVVTRRTSEIGVRIALGARPSSVVKLILREAAILMLVGIAAGCVLVIATGRTATSLLFGLSPTDPVTLVAAAAALAAVTLAASYIPARRAARLDPTSALRTE